MYPEANTKLIELQLPSFFQSSKATQAGGFGKGTPWDLSHFARAGNWHCELGSR
ncbi:hypothetical protein PPIS_a3863 [Pseudoalteromonas piscicida]|uniref:Uncharacterized protein n=1 Tax=Pseudoalteromonas piscicida TaxID=43662 RepID=A0ABM6NIB6_PSEO7|nr:hypothetical protein PPIS_a3863 [Pseudoalteromonas piscicida]